MYGSSDWPLVLTPYHRSHNLVRSLTCVYAAVTRQITELSERLATHGTAVRPLICVYTAVSRQMTEPSESLAAHVTAVRSLICVYAAVTRQKT